MTRPLTALLAAFVVAAALAQQPSGASPHSGPVANLRTGTRLVVVDVVVTDGKGRPVRGLKPDDFILLENRASQQLKSFEEHSGLTAQQQAQLQPRPQLPPGVFTNFTPAPPNGSALNVLLIDKVDTALVDQPRLRQELMEYIKKVKPGTRVAIFALTHRLTMLQGFTDDPAMLRAALAQKAQAAFASVNRSQPEFVELNTAQAIAQLGRFLSGIPGRKNLIWFSGHFPLNAFPPQDNGNPMVVVPDTTQQVRDINDLLTESQVAVYPVDVTGLVPPPSAGAAMGGGAFVGHPRALAAMDRNQASFKFDEHANMRFIADSTGGRAFYDTNGLMDAVDRAIDDGSNYYTLTYTPANEHWDGSFRRIDVVLRQPLAYELHYRHGYYAADPATRQPKNSRRSGPPARGDALYSALMPGSPQPTQIVFDVKVAPASQSDEDKLTPGNEPSPGLKPPYRRYGLNFAAAPQGMAFKTVQGMHQGKVEFIAFLFDPAGKLLNGAGTAVEMNFTPARWAQVMKGGVPFHEEISVPAKGDFFLRLAVHDLTSDRIGAMEVPISGSHGLTAAK